jgi:hypothetical protein
MGVREAIACVEGRLHPFSAQVLQFYLAGHLSTGEFLRWFHMPNSSYLPLGVCIVSHLAPDYVPGTNQPEILNAPIRCPQPGPDCLI